MSLTLPKPKTGVPRHMPGITFEEVDGVRYPLRFPTPEITGHPIAGEVVDGVWYAIEEDEYVAEGEWHSQLLFQLCARLIALVRHRPSAHVCRDRITYWQKGSSRNLVPDLQVLPVFEEPLKQRKVMQLWKEASWPIFVLEVLSDSTSDRDLEEKYEIYQDEMRVPEYFICEPEPGKQEVWGHRLEGGEYREIEPDERGRVWSEQLEAWFGADATGMLQVWDAQGRLVPAYEAALEGRETTEQARVTAEQQRSLAEQKRVTAEQQWSLAEQERDTQARRAAAAEDRVRLLEEALRRSGIEPPGDPTA